MAGRLIDDYVASSLENTMGHLYDMLFARLAEKVTNDQKKLDGYRGIDFIQKTLTEVRLVDLTSSSNTKNGGARTKSANDMKTNVQYWEKRENVPTDDNPLPKKNRQVVAVWAVARGASSQKTVGNILRLRGDSMWDYFGAGPNLLQRLGSALANSPIEEAVYHSSLAIAKQRLTDTLIQGYTKDGTLVIDPNNPKQRIRDSTTVVYPMRLDSDLDWPKLLRVFP